MTSGIRKWTTGVASLSALVLLSGCLQDDGGGSDAGSGDDTKKGDGKVEIIGAVPEAEAKGFNDALKAFESESGIDVTYTPSADFTTEVRTKVQGGDPPDIAFFPQPGLVTQLADAGDALPLNDLMDVEGAADSFVPGFVESVTVDDKVYAIPVRMAVKSLVWYPKPQFEEAGYAVPETWADLEALQQKMIDDGNTPWCLGAESGADTGWVYTDWMEEMMLRTAGPEKYDEWVAHEIPFDDEAVVKAGEELRKIIENKDAVRGGAQGSLSTPFGESILPMFDEKPGCFLHRQGNFITTFMPKDVQKDLPANVGVFLLPGDVEGGFEGQPILGAGDYAAAFTNDSDVVEVLEFFASKDFGGEWAKAGGWLSPNQEFDTANYSSEIDKQIAELVADADEFRFDGSDLMPAEVGAGTFWDEMVAWVGGEKELKDALTAVEESWRD